MDDYVVAYGVVVLGVPDAVDHTHFHPHVAVVDERGVQRRRADRSLISAPFDEEKHGTIHDVLVQKWVTPMEKYAALSEDDKTYVNCVKKYLEKNKCSVSFHDGVQDQNCKFHGKHLHIMVTPCTNEPSLGMNSSYRTLRMHLPDKVEQEKIRNNRVFARYMNRPPRIYLGASSNALQRLGKAGSIIQDDQPQADEPEAGPSAPKRRPQMFTDVEDLLRLFSKYNTTDKFCMASRVIGTVADAERWRELTRNCRWSQTYKTALEEYSTLRKIDRQDFYSTFMSFNLSSLNRLSHRSTTDYFTRWCDEQKIDLKKFIAELYIVLRKLDGKKNCVYLQGESNSGKTFMMHMLVPDYADVGTHITSKEFPFQECVNSSVILINELTLTTSAEAELYKNVLGGELTKVNVKCRPAEWLPRTPVLVTPNMPIWRHVLNERTPIMNRMYTHMHLKKSKVAAEFAAVGIPNYRYLQSCFRYLDSLVEDGTISPSSEMLKQTDKMTQLPYVPLRIEPVATPDVPVDMDSSESDTDDLLREMAEPTPIVSRVSTPVVILVDKETQTSPMVTRVDKETQPTPVVSQVDKAMQTEDVTMNPPCRPAPRSRPVAVVRPYNPANDDNPYTEERINQAANNDITLTISDTETLQDAQDPGWDDDRDTSNVHVSSDDSTVFRFGASQDVIPDTQSPRNSPFVLRPPPLRRRRAQRRLFANKKELRVNICCFIWIN